MIQFLRSLPRRLLGLPARDFCSVSKHPHLHARVPQRASNLQRRVKYLFSDSQKIQLSSSIPIGVYTFEQLAQARIFVDKTNFLYYLFADSQNKLAISICRPRRWGKTIQLYMINSYFKIDVDKNGKMRYKSSSLWKKDKQKMTPNELENYCRLLGECLLKFREQQLDSVIKKTSMSLKQEINFKQKAIFLEKEQAKMFIGLIHQKMVKFGKPQLEKFIITTVNESSMTPSEIMLFLLKIRYAKKTIKQQDDQKKKQIKTQLIRQQNEEIGKNQFIIAALIKKELSEIQEIQVLLRVGDIMLECLKKQNLLRLLKRLLKEPELKIQIEKINDKLKPLDQTTTKNDTNSQSQEPLLQLKELIKNFVKQNLSQIDINELSKHLIQTMEKVRQDEALVGLIQKKQSKVLFYRSTKEESLKITQDHNQKKINDYISKSDLEYLHMGEYPIIFLTLPNLEGVRTLEKANKKIKQSITQAFKEHSYLINVFKQLIDNENSQILKQSLKQQLQRFKKILNYAGSEANSTEQDCRVSLPFLSQLLSKHYQKQVIYLIDEYDKPYYSSINQPQSKLIQKQVTEILSKVLKQDKNAYKIILTGITRGYGVNLFSGMNNIIYYGLNTNVSSPLNQQLGFTQNEVDSLVLKVAKERQKIQSEEKIDINKLKDSIKKWCNGYCINNAYVYNPWSVCSILYHPDKDHSKGISGGWTVTGNMGIIKQLIIKYPQAKQVKDLMTNDQIQITSMQERQDLSDNNEKTIDECMRYLYYHLFHGGYITKVKDKQNWYKIPNLQVKQYFYNVVVKNWIKIAKGINAGQFEPLAKGLIENITNNLKIRETIQKFLGFEVKNSKQIQLQLNSQTDKKIVKLSEFDLSSFFTAATFWYRFSFPQQTIFTLARPEFKTEHGKKIDFLFLPSTEGQNTAVVFEFKLVSQKFKDHTKQATKKLENAIWQILANDYLLDGVKACEKNNIKNIKIVAVVGHSQSHIWIKSHTFTKEKGRQLSNIFENFVKQQSGSDKKKEQTVIRNKLIDGPSKSEINQQQDKRKKLLDKAKEKNLYKLLEKYQFQAELLNDEQQPQRTTQNQSLGFNNQILDENLSKAQAAAKNTKKRLVKK